MSGNFTNESVSDGVKGIDHGVYTVRIPLGASSAFAPSTPLRT